MCTIINHNDNKSLGLIYQSIKRARRRRTLYFFFVPLKEENIFIQLYSFGVNCHSAGLQESTISILYLSLVNKKTKRNLVLCSNVLGGEGKRKTVEL